MFYRIMGVVIVTVAIVQPAFSIDKVGGKILATYDGKKMTVEQFAEEQPGLVSWLGIGAGVDQVKNAVEDSIFESLVTKEAQDEGLLQEPDVKAQVAKILFAAYMKRKVPQDSMQVQETEVMEFYEKNKVKYKNQELLKISELLFKSKDDAMKAQADLRAGMSWQALSKRSLDSTTARRSGLIGSVPPNALQPDLRSAALTLEPGRVSDPVKSAFGYHLIKLEEKPTITYRPLDEVKKEIYAEMVRSKKRELAKDVRAELWKKYRVSIDDATITSLVNEKTSANAQVERSSLDRTKRQPGQATELQVVSEMLDLGKIAPKKQTGTILIANASEKEITIYRVGSTCKCIEASIDLNKVGPGQSAKLTFTYDPNMFKEKSRVEKILYIESTDAIEPRKFIRLNIEVNRS